MNLDVEVNRRNQVSLMDKTVFPITATLIHAYRTTLFAIGALAMAAMMGIVMAEVVCRYGLGFSLVWSEELCRVILIWITFIYAGLALDRGEVVAFDLLLEKTGSLVRAAILLIGGIVSLGTLIYLTKLGLDYALFSAGDVLPAMQISMFWVYLAVPIGLGLFAVHLLVRLIRQIGETLGLLQSAGA